MDKKKKKERRGLRKRGVKIHPFHLPWIRACGVTLFALVLHLNCTALGQSESSKFFMYIIIRCNRLLHDITSCYSVLHCVIRCNKVLHCVTQCYKVLHGVTSCYFVKHGKTQNNSLLHRVTPCNTV